MGGTLETQLVPVRLGAILKMIRKAEKKGIMKITEDIEKKSGDYSVFSGVTRIHHTTWSGYEMGNRMPNEENLDNLVEVIYRFFRLIFGRADSGFTAELEVKEQDFKAMIRELHYKDQFIKSLEGVAPLRYIGAMVLAYYFHDVEKIKRDPIPDEYYREHDLMDSSHFSEAIYEWYGKNTDSFRDMFAHMLLQENRFNSQKIIEQSISIIDAEKHFENNSKQASHKPGTKLFCAEAFNDKLFFEFQGAAVDAILSLSKSIQYNPEMSSLKIDIHTQEGGNRTLILFKNFVAALQ